MSARLNKEIIEMLKFFLFVFAALTAAAQPAAKPLPLPPVCRIGSNPVDPTYRWVPPVTWRLVKTTKPEVVTMTTGSGKEVTCLLRAGEVLAYPPDGSEPLVVLCKNKLTKGRPQGTEIPRENVTFNVTVTPPPPGPPRLDITGIPNEIKIVHEAGEIKVVHSGVVEYRHSGTIRHEIISPPVAEKKTVPKVTRCGRGCKIALTVLAGAGGGAGIYFGTRGSSSGPGPRGPVARTGPAF